MTCAITTTTEFISRNPLCHIFAQGSGIFVAVSVTRVVEVLFPVLIYVFFSNLFNYELILIS